MNKITFWMVYSALEKVELTSAAYTVLEGVKDHLISTVETITVDKKPKALLGNKPRDIICVRKSTAPKKRSWKKYQKNSI